MKIIIGFVIGVMIVISPFAHSQNFYLSWIDTESGKITNIDSIPGLLSAFEAPRVTCINEKEQHYIFYGLDTARIYRLYSIDLNTGKTVHSPPFLYQTGSFTKVMELKMNKSNNLMYGFYTDTTLGMWAFISLDPATGINTIIDTIADIVGLESSRSGIDTLNNLYLTSAISKNNQNKYLYAIDIASGRVVSKKPMLVGGAYPVNWQYDPSSGNFIGTSTIMQKYNVMATDTSTALYHSIGLTDVKWSYGLGSTAFSEKMEKYFFYAKDTADGHFLYSFNLTNTQYLKAPFRSSVPDKYHIMELAFDDSTNKLYALNRFYKWPTTTSDKINDPLENLEIFPNPTQGAVTIKLGEQFPEILIELSDIQGRQLNTWTKKNVSQTEISIEQPEGLYFLNLKIGEQHYFQRIVKN